jgi:hypothetical protein
MQLKKIKWPPFRVPDTAAASLSYLFLYLHPILFNSMGVAYCYGMLFDGWNIKWL